MITFTISVENVEEQKYDVRGLHGGEFGHELSVFVNADPPVLILIDESENSFEEVTLFKGGRMNIEKTTRHAKRLPFWWKSFCGIHRGQPTADCRRVYGSN